MRQCVVTFSHYRLRFNVDPCTGLYRFLRMADLRSWSLCGVWIRPGIVEQRQPTDKFQQHT